MLNKLKAWLDSLIIRHLPDSGHHKQARMIVRGSLLTVLFMAYYALISKVISYKEGVLIQSILTLGFALIPLAVLRRANLNFIGNLFVFSGCTGIVMLSLHTGGLESPVLPWIGLVPIVALLFTNRNWAWAWFVLTLAVVALFIYLKYQGMIPSPRFDTSYKVFLAANCLIGLVLTLFLLNTIFVNSIREINQQLESKNQEIEEKNKLLEQQAGQITAQRDQIILEKQKSDKLLLNILPADIAEELKQNGSCEARQYENVSILFTDFVNFTNYSEKMSPQSIIAELHRYFTAFDAIIEKYGLEKIKTIGDAYMAVSGLPERNSNHAVLAILAAKEIREFVQASMNPEGRSSENSGEGKQGFQARIGIHSGPVVAGIVGSKKFVFDIWGDAVNTAARIEQNGFPQKISISGQTYELVKDHFPCEYRGKVKAKNKGELDMYFVN